MIGVLGLTRAAFGSGGEVNETYLLPNTVVALICASTFAGISLMYLGSTSSVNFAFGTPPWLTSWMLATRPISTPLYVTLSPEFIDKPGPIGDHRQLRARQEIATELEIDEHDDHDGDDEHHRPRQLVRRGAGTCSAARSSGYTVRLKFGSTPYSANAANRVTTWTDTSEKRIDRPTASPTPTGPPLA